ncbi:hypothetical protein D3C77_398840 [compost metagenome]
MLHILGEKLKELQLLPLLNDACVLIEPKQAIFADNHRNSFRYKCVIHIIEGCCNIILCFRIKFSVSCNIYAERPKSIKMHGSDNILVIQLGDRIIKRRHSLLGWRCFKC